MCRARCTCMPWCTSTPTHTCAAWPSNPVEALGVRYEKTLTDSLASAVFRRLPRRLELGAVVWLGPRGFRDLPHATDHANDTVRFCLGLGHPDRVHSSRRKEASSTLLVYLPHLSGDARRWSSRTTRHLPRYIDPARCTTRDARRVRRRESGPVRPKTGPRDGPQSCNTSAPGEASPHRPAYLPAPGPLGRRTGSENGG